MHSAQPPLYLVPNTDSYVVLINCLEHEQIILFSLILDGISSYIIWTRYRLILILFFSFQYVDDDVYAYVDALSHQIIRLLNYGDDGDGDGDDVALSQSFFVKAKKTSLQ